MKDKPLHVDWCDAKAARYACEHWHYSRKMPVGKTVKVGAWEHGRFIGVVIFSSGCGKACDGRRYGLAQVFEMAELHRVALTDHATPVSRIMAIAVKFLRRQCPGLKMIVSFADPSQGHHGGIYQATGWVYAGLSNPSVEHETKKGEWIHNRCVTAGYGPGSSPVPKEALTGRKRSKPGKHRYLLPLDNEMRHRIAHLAKPYPKRAGSSESGTSGDQPEGGGANPTPALCVGRS